MGVEGMNLLLRPGLFSLSPLKKVQRVQELKLCALLFPTGSYKIPLKSTILPQWKIGWMCSLLKTPDLFHPFRSHCHNKSKCVQENGPLKVFKMKNVDNARKHNTDYSNSLFYLLSRFKNEIIINYFDIQLITSIWLPLVQEKK